MHSYYVDINDQKDGPHDLVTIMRRIRSGKITSDTLIYSDGEDTPKPAADIEDIALFFKAQPDTKNRKEKTKPLGRLIRHGWQTVMEKHVMTVYAGGMLLLCIMLASALIDKLGIVNGGMLAWAVFLIFHNIFFIFVLRLNRGQTTGSAFINNNLAPILPMLIIASITLALMMAGGLFLFVIPGMIISVLYIFVPFLIFDRRYNIAEAMYASRLLLQKRGRKYISTISILSFLHLVCLLLIIPIPVTLPIFACTLSNIYDEISAY